MTTRPTTSPLFATDATLGTGAESALTPRLDPGSGIRARGLLANTRVPARWFNYLLGTFGDWAAYLAEKTDHQFNVLNYGADKTGASNCVTAFSNAWSAAYAVSGSLVVPSGFYRFDSGLTVPEGVDVYMSSGAVLQLNHSTANFLTLTTANSVAPTRIVGGILEALVPNTGNVIYSPFTTNHSKWHFQDVAINPLSRNLNGRLLHQAGNSAIRVSNPHFFGGSAVASGVSLVFQDYGPAVMEIEGGILTAPADAWDANRRLLTASNGRGSIRGTRFDMRALTAGGAIGARFLAPSGPWTVSGCVFEGPAFSVHGMQWVAGAELVEEGNIFAAGTGLAPYEPASGALAKGSRIGGLGAFSASYGSVATIDIPTGYRAVNIRCTATTGPDLLMPSGWFEGQEMLLTYFNDTVSTVDIDFAAGAPVTGEAIPNVTAGATLTGVFVWEDRDAAGAPSRWVQKGSWGLGGTLV